MRVYYLQPDKAGQIWVGTDWGLDFFDRERQLISHARRPDLPQGFMNDLACGPDGSIWASTDRLYRVRPGLKRAGAKAHGGVHRQV